MCRSRPLPNTFTATLNNPWMCAYRDFKPPGGVRALLYPDLGLQTQSPVKITTSNLHSLAREESALATTLLPEHPAPGAPSLTLNPRVFVGIGPLGSAQFGPRTNYESVVGGSNHPGRTSKSTAGVGCEPHRCHKIQRSVFSRFLIRPRRPYGNLGVRRAQKPP
jgi:hypothetical protein